MQEISILLTKVLWGRNKMLANEPIRARLCNQPSRLGITLYKSTRPSVFLHNTHSSHQVLDTRHLTLLGLDSVPAIPTLIILFSEGIIGLAAKKMAFALNWIHRFIQSAAAAEPQEPIFLRPQRCLSNLLFTVHLCYRAMGPTCSQTLRVWLPQLFSLILLIAKNVQSQRLEAVEIKGSKFFLPSNGSQFFIRGIIYQQVPSDDGSVATNLARASADNLYVDPLSDGSACIRDIPYLQKLRINVIRSYGIDPGRDHSSCMNDLANAGIYVLADLPAPGLTISDKNPVWNDALYDRYAQVIDAMHGFTNLLGFIVGDNVIQGISPDDAGPYVKAAIRDMKAYMIQKDYRMIPIGYVNDLLLRNSAVIDPASKTTWEYLNCGNVNETIDFFGGNAVSFCKDSSYQTSGYKNATDELSNYSIPTFLASYGCGQRVNRDFHEIQVIYSNRMTSVWSGGIIYEYFEQDPEPGYGLVFVDSIKVSTLGNYRDVSTNMASASPSGVSSASYQPSNTPASCPAAGATELPPNPRAAVLPASSSGTSTSTSPIKTPTATALPLQKSRGGLSSGAKAGIGIGVAIAIIVIVAALFLFHRRRNARPTQNGDSSNQWNKSELAANDVDREDRGYSHMAASQPRAEMDGAELDKEAPIDRPVVEASAESEIRSELPAKSDGVSTKGIT